MLGYQAATLGINGLDQPTRVAGATGSPWSASSTGRWRRRSTAPRWSAVAARLLGYQGHPSRIYVRTATQQTTQVAGLLAATADPQHPEQVQASRPSDALTARVAAKSATTGLFWASARWRCWWAGSASPTSW